MKGGMQRREPVTLRVDYRKPVLLKEVAMLGQQPVSRTEEHTLSGEPWVEFLANDMAVEREHPARQRGATAPRRDVSFEK